jgi:alpha-beta hydrolase superfamily lysophospholipase
MRRFAVLVFVFLVSASAYAGPLSTFFLPERVGLLQLRVGVQEADGPARGDVLFFHGFADRLDNHGPLFAKWNAAGLRVISFDLPSHGETKGALNNLDLYDFDALIGFAADVEAATREDDSRPLILAGWSTGGLIAARILQHGLSRFERAPQAAALLAPGVAVRTLVGKFGVVTQSTLTRNPSPPHLGPISPRSPMLFPVFAADLLLNAACSRGDALPLGIPVLVITGDDTDDAYVDSAAVRSWVSDQRTRGASVSGLSCPGAFHELDNEPAPVGNEVRAAMSAFAAAAAGGRVPAPGASGACAWY